MISITIDVEKDLNGKDRGIKSLPKIIKILGKRNINATFFTTAKVLEKYPKIFQNIQKQRHEIALHGYDHERWDELKIEQKQKLMKQSIKTYNKILKKQPKGFRAPQHSIDKETLSLLEKNNFQYDSSLIPWNLHHILYPQIKIKFSNNFKQMMPHKIDKLREIPISSFILPLSAFTIRLLPFPVFKLYLRFISFYKTKVFFMHSWDLTEMHSSHLYKKCPLKEFIKRFEYMLDYFKNEKFSSLESFPPI